MKNLGETGAEMQNALAVYKLVNVVADSVKKIRPQDAWRLYDMAYDEGLIKSVKCFVAMNNQPAFIAMQEYESDLFEAGEMDSIPKIPQY